MNRDRWTSHSKGMLWLCFLVLVAVVPSKFQHPLTGPFTLTGALRKLTPYRELLVREDTVFMKGEYAGQIQNYLGNCRYACHDYGRFGADRSPGAIAAVLDDLRVNLFYVDECLLLQFDNYSPDCRFSHAGDAEWKLIGMGDAPGDRWRLFQRQAASVASAPNDAMR
jgi:hypothetical protein